MHGNCGRHTFIATKSRVFHHKVPPMADPSTLTPEPPTFSQLMDRAVLTNTRRIELLLLAQFNPIRAGMQIGLIIAGQQLACRMAADKDER